MFPLSGAGEFRYGSGTHHSCIFTWGMSHICFLHHNNAHGLAPCGEASDSMDEIYSDYGWDAVRMRRNACS